MDIISSLIFLGVGIVIIAAIFMMIREVVLWYFRINEFMQVAKESRDYLKELVNLMNEQLDISETQPSNPYPAKPTLSGWRDNGKPKPKDTSLIWRDSQ